MESFLFKSGLMIKVIMVLAFWGIRWLYSYLYFSVSEGSISNEENEELDQELDENKIKSKNIPPITTIPITKPLSKPIFDPSNRKAAEKAAQTSPFPPQMVPKKPISTPLAANAIEKDKTTLDRKRKLFKNILLADALMQRKGFTL